MLGMMALMGYFGYIFLAAAGGYLFDHWRNNGPFMLYAVLMTVSLIYIIRIYNTRIKG